MPSIMNVAAYTVFSFVILFLVATILRYLWIIIVRIGQAYDIEIVDVRSMKALMQTLWSHAKLVDSRSPGRPMLPYGGGLLARDLHTNGKRHDGLG